MEGNCSFHTERFDLENIAAEVSLNASRRIAFWIQGKLSVISTNAGNICFVGFYIVKEVKTMICGKIPAHKKLKQILHPKPLLNTHFP